MKTPTFVYIICSAGGRVGKTMMARLLGDYFLLRGRSFTGFDSQAAEPWFAERFPRHVNVVDLKTVSGQMALFDPLLIADAVPKIIDLWHQDTDEFFALCSRMDFFAEARRNGVEPVLIFLAEPSARSVAMAGDIGDRHRGVTMVVVNNEGAPWSGVVSRDALARYPAQRKFELPALDPILRNVAEARGFSFSRFLLAPPFGTSIIVRAGLKSFFLNIAAQLQSFELAMALDSAESLG